MLGYTNGSLSQTFGSADPAACLVPQDDDARTLEMLLTYAVDQLQMPIKELPPMYTVSKKPQPGLSIDLWSQKGLGAETLIVDHSTDSGLGWGRHSALCQGSRLRRVGLRHQPTSSSGIQGLGLLALSVLGSSVQKLETEDDQSQGIWFTHFIKFF